MKIYFKKGKVSRVKGTLPELIWFEEQIQKQTVLRKETQEKQP